MSNSSVAGSILGIVAPMTGATQTVAGTAGSVPAPAMGDQSKALLGSGLWGDVAGADTVQTLTATGAVTAWASLVLVDATAGNITVTLPAASGSIGKTVKVVKADSSSNIVTVAANGADTMSSIVSLVLGQQNQTLTVEAATSSSVRTVANMANAVLAEYGAVEVANQIFSTGTFVNSTNGIYALPSAGAWLLTYDLSTDGTGANTTSHVAIHSPTATVVSGSERTRGGTVTTAQALTCTILVTTTGAANYRLVGRHGGSGSMTISNSATNQSMITWQKVGGFAPVEGQTVDYISANITADGNLSATTDLTLVTNTIRGNIPYSSPYFTLEAGKTYELMASFTADIDSTNETETLTISWVDNANVALPNQNSFTYNNDFGASPGDLAALESVDPLAYCLITPTATMQVKLRATESSTSNNADVSSGWVTIKQLGSTATTITTRAMFRGYHSANLSMTGSSVNVLADTETFDTTGSFSAGTFTCPRAGFYRVNVSGYFTGSFTATAEQSIAIRKNGTAQTTAFAEAYQTGANELFVDAIDIIQCNSGDTITATVVGTSGTTFAMNSSYGKFLVEEVTAAF